MDRHWLFTWRTFGSWLPGQTGFVGNYVNDRSQRVTDNKPGEIAGPSMPALSKWAIEHLTNGVVSLGLEQAKAVAAQLHETAVYRGRVIDALAILPDHVHLVFGVVGDPNPDQILVDWKRYASRPLNRLHDRRERWARGRVEPPLKSAINRARAVRYVRRQECPLVVWTSEAARALVAVTLDGDIDEAGPFGEPRVPTSG